MNALAVRFRRRPQLRHLASALLFAALACGRATDGAQVGENATPENAAPALQPPASSPDAGGSPPAAGGSGSGSLGAPVTSPGEGAERGCDPGFTCARIPLPPRVGDGELGTRECSVPSGEKCDPLSDCGCPALQTCYLELGVTPGCRELYDGPLAAYAGCEADGQCSARHSCVGGACKHHCASAADCEWPGAECVPIDGPNGTRENWNVCTRNCDPTSPQSPRPGFQACGPLARCDPRGSASSADCVGSRSSNGEGGPCDGPDDCLPGLTCADSGRCAPWCTLASPSCPSLETCVPTNPPTLSQGAELGVCRCPGTSEVCDLFDGCGCSYGTTCSLSDVLETPECRYSGSPFGDGPYAGCVYNSYCPELYSCRDQVCVKQCRSALDCGWDGAQCLPIIGQNGLPIPGVGKCSRHCDLAAPDAPGAGFQACGFPTNCALLESAEGQAPETDCVAAGMAGEGAACGATSECQRGLLCSDVCRRWCRVGADTCAAGFRCEPVLSVSGVAFGLCLEG